MEENPDFEKWVYTSTDDRTGMPLMTHMIYRVCNNDTSKWDEALSIVEKAFNAGVECGKKIEGDK